MGGAVTVPYANEAHIAQVQTSATGATFVTLADTTCDAVEIVNNGTVDVEYQRDAAGLTIAIPAKTSRLIVGIRNANVIGIRRVDQSNTQITLNYEWLRVR